MANVEKQVDELEEKVEKLQRQVDELQESLKSAIRRIRVVELKVPHADE